MWTKKAVLVVAIVFAIQHFACARTWRPVGQPTIKGDFVDVVGTNVTIRTENGMKSVAYGDLSDTDKAVVKSSLQSKGRSSEAMQLDGATSGESASGPFMGLLPPGNMPPGSGDEVDGSMRTWTDLVGNKLVAAFVGTRGPDVYLRASGEIKPYPIKAFSVADQEWIDANRGPDLENDPSSGMASNPGMTPGSGGYRPPSGPRFPTIPPPTFTPPTFTPPNLPSHGLGGSPGGSMPGSHSAEPPYGSRSPYSDGHSATPSNPGFSNGPSPFSTPRIPIFEWTFKCRNCGATFPESSGLKQGDACPSCSPGASRRSSYTGSSRGGGGGVYIGGSVALFTLIMAFIGFMVRQIF